jgi:hypothetical protein
MPFWQVLPLVSQSMHATPPSPQPVSEVPSLQLSAPLSQQPVHCVQMTGALPELEELELEPLLLPLDELELEPPPLLLELELDERPPLELLELLEELELDPLLLPPPLPELDELELELLLLDDVAASIVGEPLLVPASAPAAGPLSMGLRPPVAHAAATDTTERATNALCRRLRTGVSFDRRPTRAHPRTGGR